MQMGKIETELKNMDKLRKQTKHQIEEIMRNKQYPSEGFLNSICPDFIKNKESKKFSRKEFIVFIIGIIILVVVVFFMMIKFVLSIIEIIL